MLVSNYEIIEEENLLIEVHNGEVVKKSLTSFKQKVAQDPKFRKNLNFLVHIKNVVFKTSQEDMQNFAKFIKNNEATLGKRKIAILTETPHQVVNSTLYQSLLNIEINQVEIFTTNFEAFKFLNLESQDFHKFNNKIQELKLNLN